MTDLINSFDLLIIRNILKKQKHLRRSPEDLKKKKIKMSTDAIRSVIDAESGILKAGLVNQATTSGNGVVTSSYAEDGIERGESFQVHRRFSITGNGTVKFALDFTSVDATKEMRTLPIKCRTSQGQVFIDTYAIDSYTGGTSIPIAKRNRTSIIESQAVFTTGITSFDVAGDELRQYIIGAPSGFLQPGGGSGGGENPKKWNHSIICFEVSNQESSTVILEMNLNWYETQI